MEYAKDKIEFLKNEKIFEAEKFIELSLVKKNAIIYQIYPQSFKDSNNDGIGDIQGIISKLDYLASLGVDFLWLSPIFVSPLVDNGYDVADYLKVNPIYGSNEDLYLLIKKAKKKNIGIMLDMVWNHSSNQHFWFQEALAGNKKYQAYYYFSSPDANGNPPADWKAAFGGPCWTYVKELNKFYYHSFAVEQPDLNWHNPNLRNELKKVADFWIKKGVKGFRFDVFNLIGKRKQFLNLKVADGYQPWDFIGNGANCHYWWQEFGQEIFWKNNLLTVGEGNESISDTLWYSAPFRRSLHSMFNFSHNDYHWKKTGDVKTLTSLKSQLFKYIEVFEKGGHLGIAFNNHDNPRMINKLLGSDLAFHQEMAKMLATIQMLWPGNAYIYQGDEFGMINAGYQKIENYQDIGTINFYASAESKETKRKIFEKIYWTSRDNSRAPVVWNNNSDCGFGSKKPWISFSSNSKYSLANDLKTTKPIFNWYQELIAYRKQNANLIQNGELFPLYQNSPDLFAFFRVNKDKTLKIFANFSKEKIKLTNFNLSGKTIFNNTSKNIQNNYLDAYQCIVLEINNF